MNKNKITMTASLLLAVIFSHAQDNRSATKADAAFHNKISDAFRKALPEAFRDWDVTLPDKDSEPMAEGAILDFCEGTTCWRTQSSDGTYDGSQIKNDFYLKSQKEAQGLKSDDADYMQKLGVVMSKFDNATRLEVKLFANETSVGNLVYCKPNGFQKLTPPTGWNSYYSSSGVLNCYSFSDGTEQNALDVSIFSMGVQPRLIEEKGEKLYFGKLNFPLNKALMKTYKVQNVILYIRGSKEAAMELVKSMDTSDLQKLLSL